MANDRNGRGQRPLVLTLAGAVVAACGATASPTPTTSGSTPSGPLATQPRSPTQREGGTLRVGLPALGDNAPIAEAYVDPHRWLGMEEVLRCCLVRTLLSYNGRTTAEGGIILQPDLAESLPDVSPDGLTWTFRLRAGLRFGPPYEDTAITSRDIVRGIERSVAVGEGALFFEPITGVAAYADERASTIVGLEAPDERTLIVRLDEPNADVATAMSLPGSSPIPADAANGHDDDYGAFLVASGPYMYEGSEALGKGGQGEPHEARQRAGIAVLVRNPSWDRSIDGLRGAWVDRIELSRANSLEDDRERLSRGDIDVAGYPLRSDELAATRADPARRELVAVATYPAVFFLPLNLALPPFDDLAVRRAIGFSLDRSAIAEILSATEPRFTTYRVARHAVPDSFENNLLLDYNPFPSPGDRGDLAAARAAMAESNYDSDADGRCDAPACANVPLIVGSTDPQVVSTVENSLDAIGISLQPRSDDADPYDVRAHNGTFVLAGWLSDTPALGGFSSVFSPPLEEPDGFAFSLSASLIGSRPEQLQAWGYDVDSVPSVDTKVAECLAAVGSERFLCAAELDQLVVERAVPFIPVAFPEVGFAFGDRVAAFSVDQSVIAPALDQIALDN